MTIIIFRDENLRSIRVKVIGILLKIIIYILKKKHRKLAIAQFKETI